MSTEATIGNLQSARRALDIALDVLKDGEGVSDANYNKLMSDITSLTERVDDLPERDEDDQDVDSKVSDWMCNNFDLNDYDASSLDVDYQIESYISNNDVEIDIEGHRFTERVVEIVKDVLAESTFAVVEPAEEEEEESDDES